MTLELGVFGALLVGMGILVIREWFLRERTEAQYRLGEQLLLFIFGVGFITVGAMLVLSAGGAF